MSSLDDDYIINLQADTHTCSHSLSLSPSIMTTTTILIHPHSQSYPSISSHAHTSLLFALALGLQCTVMWRRWRPLSASLASHDSVHGRFSSQSTKKNVTLHFARLVWCGVVWASVSLCTHIFLVVPCFGLGSSHPRPSSVALHRICRFFPSDDVCASSTTNYCNEPFHALMNVATIKGVLGLISLSLPLLFIPLLTIYPALTITSTIHSNSNSNANSSTNHANKRYFTNVHPSSNTLSHRPHHRTSRLEEHLLTATPKRTGLVSQVHG